MAIIPRRIPDEKREQIKTRLATTGNVRQTAEEFGVSPSVVIKIRDEDDGYEQLRTYKKEQFIEDGWRNISILMGMIPDKAIEGNVKDISTTIGILIDKMQLVSGEPTSRSDNANRNIHNVQELTADQAEAIVKSFLSKEGS